MYKDLKKETPKEGEKVFCGISEKPLAPKIAIFKRGKFYSISDSEIELFPTHWKYPNVPFMF